MQVECRLAGAAGAWVPRPPAAEEHQMTKQKSFKDRVRARMDKTSESYTTARRQLLAKSATEAQPEATEAPPEGAEAQPEVAETQPEVAETQPEVAETQAGVAETAATPVVDVPG